MAKDRIVGGELTNIGQFPHQVATIFTDIDQKNDICGGSIINREWILQLN